MKRTSQVEPSGVLLLVLLVSLQFVTKTYGECDETKGFKKIWVIDRKSVV